MMTPLSFSIDSLGRTAQPAIRKAEGRAEKAGALKLSKIRAIYDAAQTTDENYKHWDNADSNGANKANDASTRQTLRDRSRYECENNGYASGLVEGIANDVIGTGPRLQLSIPGVPRSTTRAIATAFDHWSEAADFPEDLRILHQTKIRDGEGFGVLINNPRLVTGGRTQVALDLKLYEAEQVSDPWDFGLDPDYVDGIRFDAAGEPVFYTFTKNHPGGVKPFGAIETVQIGAESVVHWFKPKRPGQRRGIPETSPGLPLFAQLRRYTLATIGSAEFAAMLAGIMQTDTPADGSGPVAVDAMDEIELTRNHLLTLPAGWKAEQFSANQPTTNYPQFKSEILGEIGRGIGAPFNVIAGNSSGYNYSSGRLDHLLYHRAVKVERRRLIRRIINRLFIAWVYEATIAGVIPAGLPPVSAWAWKWFFDGFESIDPAKDAQTNDVNLRNGTTTLAAIYGENGEDWEDALEQRAREIAKYRELGISDPTSTPQPAPMQQPDAAQAV